MIDFFSPDMRRNPFPVYDWIRSGTPLLYDPQSDLWMIFDYAGVKQALTDHDRFSSSMFRANRGNPEWMIFFDPPRQTKLRALISRAFTPRATARLEPLIRRLSGELLSRPLETGEMDLVQDYATPLPTLVIMEMIGMPAVEWDRVKGWSDAILRLSYAISAGSAADAAAAEFQLVQTEMNEHLPRLIEERRSIPREDLLTRLVEADVDGVKLTEQEIIGFVQLLIVAGQETSANLISNAVLCLTENPDQLARLTMEPDLLPAAIEEVLRFRSPVQFAFRATTQEVEMHGQAIPAGKLVLPIIGSANRDPKQFDEPGRFDPARDPNPHVAFGHGAHFCLGGQLARLEARIALTDILARLKRIECINECWEPRHALNVHGPARMPVRFQPGNIGAAGA